MPITVTITADTPSEARSLMAEFLGSAASGVMATVHRHEQLGTAGQEAVTRPAPVPPMPTAAAAGDDDDGDDTGPVAPVADGALDSDGLPWDARIHSGSKGQTGDGKWRKLKGVDKSIIPGVEAELRARGGSSAPVAPAPVTPSAPAPVAPPMPPVEAPQPVPAPVAPPMPVAAPAPVPPAPVAATQPTAPAPPAAPAEDPTDFHGFMQRLGNMMGPNSPVNPDYLTTLAQRIGAGYQVPFNAITDLQEKPEYIGYAITLMKHDGVWS